MPDNLTARSSALFITDRQRIREVWAVVLTGIGKFVFMDFLNWKLPVAILGWVVYIVHRHIQVPGILRYWGFRTDNFKKVVWMVLPFALVSVALFLITGHVQGTMNITWHVIPLLLLYPLWGTIQQFLMIGLVAGNLRELKGGGLNQLVIVLATAVLFAVVHFPDVWLTLGTFVLALFYGYIYLRQRNVYVLGILHGWLGALFYYTVVNRDPFMEVFGKLTG
jgi:uncharacterized protein